MEKQLLKLRGGDSYFQVETWVEDERVFFLLPKPWASPDAQKLNSEITAMFGRKWHKEIFAWSVPICKRNEIALQYLRKDMPDPFARWMKEVREVQPVRELWTHQAEILSFILSKHYCIIAGEMGVGKTLPIIEAVEKSGVTPDDLWYVGPKSAIVSVKNEFQNKWKSSVVPSKFMTYEGLKSVVDKWKPETQLPRFVIADESSRLKSRQAERTTAFQWLADAIREEWEDDGFVVLASGTPAPKDPTDWWSQVEICAPGFLKEGDPKLFRNALAFMRYDKRSDSGQNYATRVNWREDENRCHNCGEYPEMHGVDNSCLGMTTSTGKPLYYKKSVNEVARLYRRLKPIVIVKSKADCLSLPDKHYRMLEIQPEEATLDHAKNIVDAAGNAAEALILLRELSDGFLYTEQITDEIVTCPTCSGTGEVVDAEIENDAYSEFDIEDIEAGVGSEETKSCLHCAGTGITNKIVRTPTELACPKFRVLEDLLDEHTDDDGGRLVVFAAFHASIDRIRALCLSKGWVVFQVDGRGWKTFSPSQDKIGQDDMYTLFQDRDRKIPKIVWLGHPKSSGMGLTLTESPSIVFFSNSFNGEDRMQAEDRIHRPGMDLKKGATIIDLIHLPIEKDVVENLRNKVNLQNMTLGQIKKSFEEVTEHVRL